MQLNQGRRAQPQSRRIGLRENLAQKLVKQKLQLEVRARDSELNFANPVAKVQSLAVFSRGAQQPLQSSAQVRSLADIRFAYPAQQENRSRSRKFLKEAVILLRKIDHALEHTAILGGSQRSPLL